MNNCEDCHNIAVCPQEMEDNPGMVTSDAEELMSTLEREVKEF